MIGSNCNRAFASLGLALAFVVTAGESASYGQQPFVPLGRFYGQGQVQSYEGALMNRIELTGGVQASDLPNLSRLVVLEAISMRQFIRYELPNSIEGSRLVGQVDRLLQAASVFDPYSATVTNASTPAEAFADLQNAFNDLQSNLGSLPGSARVAAFRLDRMSVLLPQIGQIVGPAGPYPVQASKASPYPEIDREVTLLKRQLAALLRVLKPESARLAPIAEGAENLLALVNGFDQFIKGWPALDDLKPVFQPVRDRALQVNSQVVRQPLPNDVRARWREIKDEVERIPELLGSTRVIVVSPASRAGSPMASDSVAKLDKALAEYDLFLAEVTAAAAGLPNEARVESELQRLRNLVYRYRQRVVSGLEPQTIPSLNGLATASRQLTQRVASAASLHPSRAKVPIRDPSTIVKELTRLAPPASKPPVP